jgi:aminodeoxyfutalosine deaminase
LIKRLPEQHIVLHVCPSSNVATGPWPTPAEHPLPALLELGVSVTLGSDDPPMFGTNLLEAYWFASHILSLDRDQLLSLATTGIEASYAPDALKARLMQTDPRP